MTATAATANDGFVHLHVHSEYSLADGIVRLRPLASLSAQYGLPAVALTDLANVHGAVKFYRACLAAGVKPVIGCDILLENPLLPKRADRAIVLCRNHRGYRNLSKFLTQAYLRRSHVDDKVVVAFDDFEQLHDGLLVLLDDHEGALSANGDGRASRGGDYDDRLIERYRQLLGDALYLQVSRVGHPGEQDYVRRAARLAAAHGVGLVATNRVEFIDAKEFDTHEIRVCIHDKRMLSDQRRPRRFTPQQYLRSADEMRALFADLPEAVANTVEVAKRCNLFFNFEDNFLPAFAGGGDEPVDQMLRRQAESGLCERLGTALDAVGKDYTERLELELGVISEMGYPGYFLIVADFIRWAKSNDIPVGPGRGSGAGSLVAWATGITEPDPLRYGLLFERFLNPERVSLPDFDIDFCVDGRDRVIGYVAERYGREQVAQITTFNTLAARAAVKDVGRIMDMGYGFVDQVAQLIPNEVGITLQRALDQEEALSRRYREEDDIRQLIDNAMQLEGIARNAGKHAAGVVIAPRELTEYTPLYPDPKQNQAVTQLDKDDLEAIGLVKFDFLGLDALTTIHAAVSVINRNECGRGADEPPLDMAQLPLDDAKTFELIRRGATTAIFQLESRGIKELIVNLSPDKFDDLVALVALYRPGPLQSGMVDDFINRKHGRASVAYPHERLAPILEPTYGVILYQEQVMQIAQALAGYTLGGSDLLRQAMGKKKPEEMRKQRAVFRDGAVEGGVAPKVAEHIFDLMEKFAGYGFNKSHSVVYALIAYRTAWLKAHYPAAYMAAAMSAALSNTDRVVLLKADCADLGLKVLPPNINTCHHEFTPLDARTILYGMGAIKGVGGNVNRQIEAERERNGDFRDLFDLCRRLDPRTVNKRVLEVLIKSGALDALGEHRAALMADIGNAIQAAEQQQESRESGQSDVFGKVEAPPAKPADQRVAPWSEQHTLACEVETLGLYLSGHPYTRYRAELDGVTQGSVRALDLSRPKSGLFAGLVIARRVTRTRRGKMAFITLDNATERIEVSLFSEKYQRYGAALQKGNVLVVHGEFSIDERGGEHGGRPKMNAETVAEINAFRQAHLRHIRIKLPEEQLAGDGIKTIQRILSEHRGGTVEISFRYRRTSGETGLIKPGPDWKVNPTQQLIDALTEWSGAECLEFQYDVAGFRNSGGGNGRRG